MRFRLITKQHNFRVIEDYSSGCSTMFLTLLLTLALSIGVVLSLGAGVLTFYIAAPFIDHLRLLTIISVIVLLLVSCGFAWMASKRLIYPFRLHFSMIYAGSVLAVAIVLIVKVLPRPEIPYRAPDLFPGMSYWNCPQVQPSLICTYQQSAPATKRRSSSFMVDRDLSFWNRMSLFTDNWLRMVSKSTCMTRSVPDGPIAWRMCGTTPRNGT